MKAKLTCILVQRRRVLLSNSLAKTTRSSESGRRRAYPLLDSAVLPSKTCDEHLSHILWSIWLSDAAFNIQSRSQQQATTTGCEAKHALFRIGSQLLHLLVLLRQHEFVTSRHDDFISKKVPVIQFAAARHSTSRVLTTVKRNVPGVAI